jgi:hypothetical protein
VSLPNNNDDKKKPSSARIAIWLVVSAVGAYMLLSGVIGAISGGN